MKLAVYSACATAIGALFASTSANAVVIEAPHSKAVVSSLAHQGPNVASSYVENRNGVESNVTVGPGGSASSSGSLGAVVGDTYIPGNTNSGAALTATSHGSASLASGQLKASVFTTGPNNYGSPGGDVLTEFGDTVYFHNSTAGDLALTFTYRFDGTFSSIEAGASSSGMAGFSLSGCGSCGNLRFAADGVGVGDQIAASFNDDVGVFSLQSFGGPVAWGDSGHWHTELFGDVDALMSTTILVPTGDSTLGLRAFLNISCRIGDQCDFGHTGVFGLGALPEGLSWTSESGLLLSAVSGPPTGGGAGGVPEPATWAIMILGFGMVGASARFRRKAAAAA